MFPSPFGRGLEAVVSSPFGRGLGLGPFAGESPHPLPLSQRARGGKVHTQPSAPQMAVGVTGSIQPENDIPCAAISVSGNTCIWPFVSRRYGTGES